MPMISDYNLVKSLTPEEFNRLSSKADGTKYNQADSEEIKKMERLLDVQPGTLAPAGPYKLEKTSMHFLQKNPNNVRLHIHCSC